MTGVGAPNHWRRLITRHCLYGGDLNPLAVNLSKLALWLNCFARDHKLTFLDHHLRCGNTLIGIQDLGALRDIPDRGSGGRANLQQKDYNQVNFDRELFGSQLRQAAQAIAAIPNLAEDDTASQREAFEDVRQNLQDKFAPLADLYTAYIMDSNIQPEDYVKLVDYFTGDSHSNRVPEEVRACWARVCKLRSRHKFFHWQLEFPDVFATETNQGFGAIVGNPPWERTALEELEFFAKSSPEVLAAPTTALRKRVIQELRRTQPKLFEEYTEEKEKSDYEAKFYKESGLYPLGARGRLNTYALFANLGLRLLSKNGRSGLVLQSGLASDAPMEDFWRYLINERRLIAFIDFENKNRIFQAVHPEQKFALVSFAGSSRKVGDPIMVGFWLKDINELSNDSKVYELDTDELQKFSPNTGQPLMTRRQSDVSLLRKIYSTSDIFWSGKLRKGKAKAWVAMTSAAFSGKCRSEEDLLNAESQDDWKLRLDETSYYPLIEAKQIEQYNICFATYEHVPKEEVSSGNPREVFHADGSFLKLPKPRFWAKESVVKDFLRSKNVSRNWCLGYRDVTNVNNERTAIATVMPLVGFLQPLNGIGCLSAADAAIVVATFNSFTCDFVARLRFTGRHLNVTTFSQLPIPRRISVPFVVQRVVELVYTGTCLREFASDCGVICEPFSWDGDRRFRLKCELDAAFAHFYGLSKEDLRYVFRACPKTRGPFRSGPVGC